MTGAVSRRPRWRPGWPPCRWTRSSPARWSAAARRPTRSRPRGTGIPWPSRRTSGWARAGAVGGEERRAEAGWGDGPGKPLKRLAKDPLWRVVQAHPSGARFPGEDGESMPDVQHRAVGAVREWNDRLGRDATFLICSHGDVIKSLIADSLGMHLDLFQRIQVDPCSLTVIRYTPFRPFLLRMNDTGGTVSGLVRPDQRPKRARQRDEDAVI